MFTKLIVVIFILLFGNYLVFAQSLPWWFLKQGGVPCMAIAVGYSEHSYFKDTSAVSKAITRAIQLVIQKKVIINSSKSFWTTTLGNAVMRNYFKETYDTSLAVSLKNSVTVLDTFLAGDFITVLVSEFCCDQFKKQSKLFQSEFLSNPHWVTKTPENDKYFYAVGSAPDYFYKTSSWFEAEKSALYALAATKQITISSLQKSEYLVEELREEIISVTLNRYEILERWEDNNEKIYYVLIRMTKK